MRDRCEDSAAVPRSVQGSPARTATPLRRTLGTGLLALYIAFGLTGENQVNGTIGFGVLYVVIFLAVLVSPTLFGLFQVPASAPLHVIHVALAVVSLAVGYMARGRATSSAA